jgi:hypothetical protein
MDYSASGVYGGAPSPQPAGIGTAGPAHAPNTPEPTARTTPRTKGPLGNPVFILVALLAAAMLLVQLSVRGTIELKA